MNAPDIGMVVSFLGHQSGGRSRSSYSDSPKVWPVLCVWPHLTQGGRKE